MITVCDTNTTREELERVTLVKPERAERIWKGLAHVNLVDNIFRSTKDRGWALTNPTFSLSKDQADLAGAFDVSIPDLDAPNGQCFSLGFLTSNSMKRSLKLVAEARVFVCNNGVVHGDVILCHKHTINFDYEEAIDHAMRRYFNIIESVRETTDRMRRRHLQPGEVNRILVETGRQHIMPWSRVGQVDEEFRNPSFDYNGDDYDPESSWSILSAFSHIVKKSSPMSQMDMTNRFRPLLPLSVV